MAALSHDNLSSLHIGNAVLSIINYNSGTAVTALSFTGADKIYTLQDSFNLTQDTPGVNEIRVDQYNEVIDSAFDGEGNYTVSGRVPSMATDVLDRLIASKTSTAVTAMASVDGDVSYSGKAYGVGETIEVSMMVEAEDKSCAIILPRVKMWTSFPHYDDHNTPAYLEFTGVALPNASGYKCAVLPTAATV